MLDTVVWCSDRWSRARTGGLVLGTVVWCSKVVWCAMAAASTAMRMLVRCGLWWGVTVISVCVWVHVFQVAEARHWPTRFQVWSAMADGEVRRQRGIGRLTVGVVGDRMAV